MIDTDKTTKFWEWFASNEQTVRGVYRNEPGHNRQQLIDQLDNHILQFGKFSWHIGVGKNKPYYFTISPNGDAELLKISKAVVESAPDLAEWEFQSSKEALNWDYKCSVYDGNLQLCEIDASSWHYIMVMQEDGRIEISMQTANMKDLDDVAKYDASELVITSCLGEERRILNISDIILTLELENGIPIHRLQEGFEAIGK